MGKGMALAKSAVVFASFANVEARRQGIPLSLGFVRIFV